MRVSHGYRIESDCFVEIRNRFRTELRLQVCLAKKIVCLRGRWLQLQGALENFYRAIQVLNHYAQASQIDHCGDIIRSELQRFEITRLRFKEGLCDKEVGP